MTKVEFAQLKDDLQSVFDADAVAKEVKRVEKHMKKVKDEKGKNHRKKLDNSNGTDEVIVEDIESANSGDSVAPTPRVRKRRRFKRIYLQPIIKCTAFLQC